MSGRKGDSRIVKEHRCSCGAPKSPEAEHCMKCRRGNKLSTAQQESIAARLKSGESTHTLAAEYGVSHQGVSHLARKFGIDLISHRGTDLHRPPHRDYFCSTCGAKVSRGRSSCRSCSARRSIAQGWNRRDIRGQRFGKLVALRPLPTRRYRYVEWLCKCDCGNETLVSLGSLSSGNTRSCGCLLSENHRARGGKK